MAKMLAPTTAIWWVASDATFNRLVPTASALAADITSGKAVRISPAIVTGSTLNPTDSDTDESSSIEDSATGQNRGNANYEASLTLFREDDPVTNTTSIFEKAWLLFRLKGATGTLVRRIGYLPTVAPAAGQEVDMFGVVSDNPRIIEEDGGGPVKVEVPFGKTGFMNINEPLG